MAGPCSPHPQNTTCLSRVSRRLQKVFHMGQQEVFWTTVQSCFFVVPFMYQECQALCWYLVFWSWREYCPIYDSFAQCSQECKTHEIPQQHCTACSPHCLGLMMCPMQKLEVVPSSVVQTGGR